MASLSGQPTFSVLASVKRNWGEQPSAASGPALLPPRSSGTLPLSSAASPSSRFGAADLQVQSWRSYTPPWKRDLSELDPAAGVARIVVPRPAPGQLGVALKDLTVECISDPSAQQHGWRAGDRILSVAGVPVADRTEFARALAYGFEAYQATGRPLEIDVWRTRGLDLPVAPSPPSSSSPRSPYSSYGSPHGFHEGYGRQPVPRRYACGADDYEPQQAITSSMSTVRRRHAVCGEDGFEARPRHRDPYADSYAGDGSFAASDLYQHLHLRHEDYRAPQTSHDFSPPRAMPSFESSGRRRPIAC